MVKKFKAPTINLKRGPKYKLIQEEIEGRPLCPHGPTLLFESINQGKRFFACSASRNRKECNFHLNFDDFKKGKKLVGPTLQENQVPLVKFDNNRLKNILLLDENKRSFCKDCVMMLLPDEIVAHNGHSIKTSIAISRIRKPSKLLISETSSKYTAQFYFDKSSKKVIISNLLERGLTRVICVGTTSIHESIQLKSQSTGMDSILLDLDHRLGQFFPSSKFVHYNMFNHHFLEGKKGEKKLANFIRKSEKEQLVLVIDPPFGGMIETLAESIKKIFQMAAVEIPLILSFLDVNRRKINDAMPQVKMTDYILKYKGKSRTKFSRAKIFTSLPLQSFKLPEEEGYEFCPQCKKYVKPNSKDSKFKSDCTHKGEAPITKTNME